MRICVVMFVTFLVCICVCVCMCVCFYVCVLTVLDVVRMTSGALFF